MSCLSSTNIVVQAGTMGSSSMWMSLLLPALLLVAAMSAETITPMPRCQSSCGGIDIFYPFGIGDGCFHKDFKISCLNNSIPVMSGTRLNIESGSHGSTVMSGTGNLDIQVLKLSLSPPVAQVLLPISWQCFDSNDNDFIIPARQSDGWASVDAYGAYRISSDLNDLVVLGCNTSGQIKSVVDAGLNPKYQTYIQGCEAFVSDTKPMKDGTCSGAGCCSVDVMPGLTDNIVWFTTGNPYRENLAGLNFCLCNYAFIVHRGYYNFTTADLNMDGDRIRMPVSLDWAIRDNNDSCSTSKSGQGYACLSDKSYCIDSSNGPGYTCNCTKGYEGNPYVANGCTDINECQPGKDYPCKGTCKNTVGDYICYCTLGYQSSDPFTDPCKFIIPPAGRISIGIVAGIFLFLITAFIIILRKERRHRDEIYRKNGGPTLEKASIIKLFKKEDLIPILKPSNIIGKGGFGEVYKGLLDDVWVAIKKPISGNQMEANQFANEVIIQSKVIHKNIVRLIGCCLEVDTPMLVYEFISQGSMDDILHGGEKKHLSLDARLTIAAESAQGLAYMHSQTNIVILHGDVKPANILLDEKSVPKISDFGISRLIARDNEHAASVIGDMTYMDPVYQQSGLLTAKSDVYSFGVVILELISRKKATHRDNSTLVNSFLENQKKGVKSTELFDTEIIEGAEDLLESLTELAIKCLDLDVDQRPTMTEVAEQLFALTRSHQE